MPWQSEHTAKGRNSQDGVRRTKKAHKPAAPAIPTHSATSDYVPLMFRKKHVVPQQSTHNESKCSSLSYELNHPWRAYNGYAAISLAISKQSASCRHGRQSPVGWARIVIVMMFRNHRSIGPSVHRDQVWKVSHRSISEL